MNVCTKLHGNFFSIRTKLVCRLTDWHCHAPLAWLKITLQLNLSQVQRLNKEKNQHIALIQEVTRQKGVSHMFKLPLFCLSSPQLPTLTQTHSVWCTVSSVALASTPAPACPAMLEPTSVTSASPTGMLPSRRSTSWGSCSPGGPTS